MLQTISAKLPQSPDFQTGNPEGVEHAGPLRAEDDMALPIHASLEFGDRDVLKVALAGSPEGDDVSLHPYHEGY